MKRAIRNAVRLGGAIGFAMSLLGSVATAAEVEWKFFTYFPANDKATQMNREFVKDVYDSSGGRFEIKLFTPGELPYKVFDAIKIASTGQVDMADVAPGVATEIPEVNVFTMPFLCTDYDSFYKGLEVAEETIDATMRERFGIRVLFNWTMPPNNLWLKPNVTKFADLDGLKVRIWNPIQVPILALFNGVPVSITSAEVAPGLQRGVIDGAFTSSLSASDWKLYEMVSSGFLPNFSMGHNLHMVNEASFQKLPADLQELLLAKSKVWAGKFREGIAEAEQAAFETLTKHNVALNRPSEDDLTATRAKMRPIWDKWAADSGPVAQKLLEDVNKACGS